MTVATTSALRSIPAPDIPPQLHVQRWSGASPSRDGFAWVHQEPAGTLPVDREWVTCPDCQPRRGGMWTADVTGAGSSGFLDYFMLSVFFLNGADPSTDLPTGHSRSQDACCRITNHACWVCD